MEKYFLINILILIVILTTLIFFGIFILIKQPKRKEVKILSVVTFLIALYVFLTFFENEPFSINAISNFLRLDFVVGPILIFFVWLFSINFPERKKINFIIKIVMFIIPLVLGYFTYFTDLVVKNIEYIGRISFEFGILYNLMSAYVISVLLWILASWLFSYKRLIGYKKLQLKYVFFACLIVFVTNIVVGTLLQNQISVSLFRLGIYSSIVFPLLVGYSILRYRLMNINIIIQKSLVYVLSIVFISVIYSIIILVANFINLGLTRDHIVVAAGISVIFISLTLPILQHWFTRITDKIFFKNPVDYEQTIKNLNYIFNSQPDLDSLISKSIQSIRNQFKVSSISFLYCNSEVAGKCDYYISRNQSEDKTKIHSMHFLSSYFKSQNVGVTMLFEYDLKNNKNGIAGLSKKNLNGILDEFNELDVVACLSIKNKELLGILCIGGKLNKEPFYFNDVEWFNVVGQQFGLAIERAALYNNLEKLVTTRTRQLKASNDSLKSINEGKSEFVSIASHQLRTPLTVIKSIFSLALGGDLGKLTNLQKEYSQKGFNQSQKLIKLIQLLLNVSRIDAGRISLDLKLNDLNEVVVQNIKDYSLLIKKQGLVISSNLTEIMPLVLFDRSLIYEVVANLLDNAIKYTHKGEKIILNTKVNDKSVVFEVCDNGIGISKQDISKIFNKFTRGFNGDQVFKTGTGLGLYFARRVIESHNGNIGAKSKGVNTGSIFYFELPIINN